jgi:Spy/CpxP family protein refolding chaperone
MGVQNGSESGSTNSSPPTGARRARRGWIIAGVAVGAVAMLCGAGALVYARDGGWHHHGHGTMTGAAFADHIEHGVKYVLSEVDATAEQKAQVTAILQTAATDVHALADQHFAAREQLHQILSAETIDRQRLETVRVGELHLADEASKRILQGIADAAEVLTPQQRAALAEHMEEHGHWRQSKD